MNLNSHSANEPVIYNNYDTPLNGGTPLGAHNARPDFQPVAPQSNYSQQSNYFQLTSNERHEFLKSIGVMFPSASYSVNNLVNSPVLGHHYLSDPHSSQPTQVKREAFSDDRGEDKTGCDSGGVNATGGSYPGHLYENEVKEVSQAYQTLDEYGMKQIDNHFMESSNQQQQQQQNQNSNNRSLAQKLVLAKINGSKYSSNPESKSGRGSGRGRRGSKRGGSGGVVEYRVVKKVEEEEENNGGERLVVEPEYSTASREFDRTEFEKTFANYTMVTTAGSTRRGRKSQSGDPLADGTLGPSPVKKFPCVQCDKSFTLKQNLTYHVNSIHLGVRIKCVECDKSFAHKPNLIAHMQSAHNGVRFKCDHCIKSFNQKPNLISHIKSVHEGIKYKCEECTKTFAQKQNLLSHVQAIHMGIKYTCEICSKSYNQVSNLLSHMTTVHQAEKHKCADCGRLFAQAHTLRAHIAAVHMDIVYEMGGQCAPPKSRNSVEQQQSVVKVEEEEAEEEEEEEDERTEEEEEEFEEKEEDFEENLGD